MVRVHFPAPPLIQNEEVLAFQEPEKIMFREIAGALLLSLMVPCFVYAQSFTDEEFTDEDFAKFFGLIEDGKITAKKMNARCAEEILGFTFAAKGLVHEGGPQRVYYNETGLNGTVDGRSLRSRHFNLSLGEWTGAVFKPICPGMWVFTVDFVVGARNGGAATTEPAMLHLYVWRAGEERPGRSVLSVAAEAGESRHMTIALPLHTADEVTTWSEAPELADDRTRVLERVVLTGYKIAHLEKYIEEFDVEIFNQALNAAR